MNRDKIESVIKAEKRLRSLEKSMDRIYENESCISVGVLDMTAGPVSRKGTRINIAAHLDDEAKHDLRERVVDAIRKEITKLEKEIEDA